MTKDTTQEPQGTPVSKEDALNGWGESPELLEVGVKDEQGKTHGASDIPRNADFVDEDKNEEELEDEEDLPEPDVVDDTIELEDPGDYTPADYSFKVTVFTGEEGKEKQRIVTVHSVEEGEALLDEDPNFGSAKNLLDFNRKLTKMEANLERDEDSHRTRKTAYDEAVEQGTERQERINLVANELKYLETKGKLPAVAAKYRNADWNDTEVAKQPGVKEQLALLKYMAKENKERSKLGLGPMGALDAFNSMQAEAIEKRGSDNRQTAADNRKRAGARVAGTSPAPVSNVPKGIAVGRGGSLRDLGNNGWGF